MNEIVEEVVKRIQQQQQNTFEVEASGRQEIDALFGPGYQLTKVKDLSQPGQFVCKERITVAGPKGLFQNVVILGPERSESQVEVSMTDTRILGINAPVRESGKTEGTPGVTLMNGSAVVTLSHGLIVAKRHIHMTPEDALKNKVSNSQIVQVKVEGTRPLIFDDVVVRISPRFATYMQLLSSSYSVALAEAKEAFPEEMFVRFPDVNWVTKEQKQARGLIVKRLTLSQVNAIAHLQETDELVKNILAFLFEGKPVLVLTPIPSVIKNSRLKYRLKQTIQENVDMCQQFGMIFYHDSENYAMFQAACQKQFRSLAEPKRTYITEKQLIRMTEAGVSLSKNAYLTPLATDYARKHQLLT